jgi:hypothetical protein
MRYTAMRSSFHVTIMVALLHGYLLSAALAENVFETRYQYYQEDNGRIRVDSDYSLFSVDLNDSLILDGTLLYSLISGASPTGLPGTSRGAGVPAVEIEDERYATTLGLTGKIADHSLRGGASYSYESDYTSFGASLTDTISLNDKNTELVLGFAYSHDTVGANGSDLSELKRSYDWILGVNQVLGPHTLLSANLTLGWKDGYLSDPYKRALIDNEVFLESRPDSKFEQLLHLQLTQQLIPDRLSMEVSYRFGHNDHGIVSHTASLAFYQYLFNKAVVLRPSFRFYDQSAADYYDTSFSGDPNYYSSDYRVSAEQTFNLGMQVRWNIIPDKLALDLGYERYITRGTDGKTSQSAYPDAHSITAGVHLQF